jgi:hypothetical protein
LLRENARGQVVQVDEGYLVFDDTAIDRDFSQRTELVRRQYSGNAHGLIKGIGVVTLPATAIESANGQYGAGVSPI